MVRGLLLESEKLNCESQDIFQVVDSKRRAAERQLEEIRAQLSSEKQLRSMAEAKDGEREAIAAVELQVLQDRVAKLREQNKTLAEARERAEEERDDLDAQVSLLKAERGKVPRQEIQLRELQAQLIAKSKDWDLVIDARDKALKKCENLEVQVADLQDQVASAHEAGPKMSTLSRMLREQLTVKVINLYDKVIFLPPVWLSLSLVPFLAPFIIYFCLCPSSVFYDKAEDPFTTSPLRFCFLYR